MGSRTEGERGQGKRRTGGQPERCRKPVRDREPENGIQRTREGQGAGHGDRERMRVTGRTTERWSKRKTGTESRMKVEQ